MRTHGRIATYNHGCRCDPCMAENVDRMRRWRLRTYAARSKPAGAVMCVGCCEWFHPRGIGPHEQGCMTQHAFDRATTMNGAGERSNAQPAPTARPIGGPTDG